MIRYIRAVYMITSMLLIATSAEAQTTDSPSVRLRYFPYSYEYSSTASELGVIAADNDYSATAPFVTGFITGMAAPFTTGYSVYLIDKTVGTAGPVAGLAGFALTLWGGKKLVDRFPVPTPEPYLTELAQHQQASFEYSYTKRVEDKRVRTYSVGVALGILADLAFVFWLASQIGPIGA